MTAPKQNNIPLSQPDKDIVFRVYGSPYFWGQKAEQLKYAAEILWPHAEKRMNLIRESIEPKSEIDILKLEPDVFSIFLSLIGFSTEALFKGLIIFHNPNFVSNGQMTKHLTTHDLVNLSKLARVPLTQNEEIFCEHAYKAMMVDSRYPIDKNNKTEESSIRMGGHCKDVFTKLYNKIHPSLQVLYTKKGWKPKS